MEGLSWAKKTRKKDWIDFFVDLFVIFRYLDLKMNILFWHPLYEASRLLSNPDYFFVLSQGRYFARE